MKQKIQDIYNTLIISFWYSYPGKKIARIKSWILDRIIPSRRKFNKEYNYYLSTLTPGTIIQGCTSQAMMITEPLSNEIAQGIDLFTGQEKSEDPYHCHPDIISPDLALTILVLGDTYMEAKKKAWDLMADDSGNFYDSSPKNIKRLAEQLRAERA